MAWQFGCQPEDLHAMSGQQFGRWIAFFSLERDSGTDGDKHLSQLFGME